MTALAILEEEIVTALLWNGRLPQQIISDHLAAKDRFAVHRNTVMTTLRQALSHTYPVVHQLVGDDFFIHMAHEHIRSRPPHDPALVNYGGGFAEFITHFKPAQTLHYLSDVARFEWAWHCAYHAADDRKLDPLALSRASTDAVADLVFKPHPATRLFHSAFPVYGIWTAHRGDIENEVSLPDEACWLAICRPEMEVDCWLHTAAEYAVLNALMTGQSLGAAAEAGLQTDPNLALDQLLAAIIVRGYFMGVTAAAPPASPHQTGDLS